MKTDDTEILWVIVKRIGAALILAAVVLVVAAVSNQRWVSVPVMGASLGYIDESDLLHVTVDGDSFVGFHAWLIFDKAGQFTGAHSYLVVGEDLDVVVNCMHHEAIGKRLAFIDSKRVTHAFVDEWRDIKNSPAADIAAAVMVRVCNTTGPSP